MVPHTSLIAAGTAAGLVPVDRCVALTAELRGGRLITRASLGRRRAAARARAAGTPTSLNAHLEVLVFQLAHDAELAATAAVSLPTENGGVRPAINDVRNSDWGRVA